MKKTSLVLSTLLTLFAVGVWGEDENILKIKCDVNPEYTTLDIIEIHFDKNYIMQSSSWFWRKMKWDLKITNESYVATALNGEEIFSLDKKSLEMIESIYKEPYVNCREMRPEQE